MTELVSTLWVNGQRLPFDAVHVSARDRGLLLADGLFETMRARNGTIFRLERHLERLRGGLVKLQIPVPPELADWLKAAVRAADLPEVAVRMTVTRGVGSAGVIPPEDSEPTVVIAINPMPAFGSAVYEAGLRARVASGRRNEYSMTAGLKTIAYTDNIAALLEARRDGADEALFLDVEGHCSEATASNLFMRSEGILVTPPLSCGALPGVTRALVLELSRAAGLDAAERPFTLDELLRADEAFLTSSLRGIAPLVSIDGKALGTGSPGSVTRELSAAHAKAVTRELGT
jgi:branched-chain amino acid aminotransferase